MQLFILYLQDVILIEYQTARFYLYTPISHRAAIKLCERFTKRSCYRVSHITGRISTIYSSQIWMLYLTLQILFIYFFENGSKMMHCYRPVVRCLRS